MTTDPMDPRWHEVAEVLVRHSTAVQPGERVMIAMIEMETLPLAQALYAACVKAGALPQVQFLSEALRHALLKHGSADQHSWLPEIEAYGMEWADVYLGLRGASDPGVMSEIPAAALAANQRAQGQISALRWAKTRWCLVPVPTEALAAQAGTDLETLKSMFFAACLMDYERGGRRWRKQADRLQGARRVRIVAGEETDLTFSVEGRSWGVFDGKINLPDGEIYTAPVEDSTEGRIHFELPGVLRGQVAADIRLEWRAGELVRASAASNGEFLRRVLETDAGASRLGEFAFGMNPHVNRFCRDILYDERSPGRFTWL